MGGFMTIIACLGDSITEGVGDSLGIGWVGRLNAFLQEKEPDEHTIYNLGISGDRIIGAMNRYFSEVLIRNPDLVLIGIGTNDCQRNGADAPEELTTGKERLFYQWQKWEKHLCSDLHKTVIIGVLPSDDSFMPYIDSARPNAWYLKKDLEEYNNDLRDFCEVRDIPFIDLWAKWNNRMIKTHLQDGLHPNDNGYDFMFEEIASFLEENKLV